MMLHQSQRLALRLAVGSALCMFNNLREICWLISDHIALVKWQVASGSEDHSVRIWDLRKRGALYTIPAHQSLVSQVCVSAGVMTDAWSTPHPSSQPGLVASKVCNRS